MTKESLPTNDLVPRFFSQLQTDPGRRRSGLSGSERWPVKTVTDETNAIELHPVIDVEFPD